jgi:uncharacterized damage-inducible protein DinB
VWLLRRPRRPALPEVERRPPLVIIDTLRHLTDSEASYPYQLTGASPDHPWRGEAAVGLDVLAATWEQFLAGDVDSERLGESRSDKGEVFAIPAGVFITQALHHANEHRAQICTILGTLGQEPSDVSAWGYAFAAGRSTLKSVETDA